MGCDGLMLTLEESSSHIQLKGKENCVPIFRRPQ